MSIKTKDSDKALIERKTDFVSKVRNFFRRLFYKKNPDIKAKSISTIEKNTCAQKNNCSDSFIESIKLDIDNLANQKNEMQSNKLTVDVSQLTEKFDNNPELLNELSEEQYEKIVKIRKKEIEDLQFIVDKKRTV